MRRRRISARSRLPARRRRGDDRARGASRHDEANAVSALIVTKVGVQTSTGTVETPLAAAMNTTLVRRKIIYFYAYTNYDGPSDLEWAKAASKAWLGRVAELNLNR